MADTRSVNRRVAGCFAASRAIRARLRPLHNSSTAFWRSPTGLSARGLGARGLGVRGTARYGCGDVAIACCRARPVKNARKHAFRRNAHQRGRAASANFRRQRAGAEQSGVILYGWHTVTAALANPARQIRKLLATENALRRLAYEGIRLLVEPELVRPDAIAARLSPDRKSGVEGKGVGRGWRRWLI